MQKYLQGQRGYLSRMTQIGVLFRIHKHILHLTQLMYVLGMVGNGAQLAEK